MITVSADHAQPATASSGSPPSCIIARPNQSASWQNNKQLLVVVGLLSGLIASAFTAIGAWLILPVTGLEITALGSALYIVCQQAQQRHVLYFRGNQLLLHKGRRQCLQRWQLNKATTRIYVERQAHPWDPVKISLCCQSPGKNSELIPVGDFLNQDDSQQLLMLLRQQGLSVSNDSAAGMLVI